MPNDPDAGDVSSFAPKAKMALNHLAANLRVQYVVATVSGCQQREQGYRIQQEVVGQSAPKGAILIFDSIMKSLLYPTVSRY